MLHVLLHTLNERINMLQEGALKITNINKRLEEDEVITDYTIFGRVHEARIISVQKTQGQVLVDFEGNIFNAEEFEAAISELIGETVQFTEAGTCGGLATLGYVN